MLRKGSIGLVLVLLLVLVTAGYTQESSPQASVVFGQPDFTSNAANRGGQPDANTLRFPLGIIVDSGGGVYIADRDNHRVLYFANNGDTTADRVYGQHGNFTSHIVNNDGSSGSLPGASADTLFMPTTVALDSAGGLYVTDRDNHRALYFANDGDTTADRVYGQFGNFTTNVVNNDGNGANGLPSAGNIGVFSLGIGVDTAGNVYISDSANNRILYFANDGDTVADRVYGQHSNFASGVRNNDGSGNSGSPSADSLNFPRGLALDAQGGLYVADRENHRILYFANDGDTTADRVYGQYGSFTTGVANNDGSGNTGAPNADNLFSPRAVAVDHNTGGLYIADANNSRILYFANDGDTTADWVFGQAGNFNSGVANNDGSGNSGAPNATNLNGPQGVAVGSDGRLYISDTNNNRALIVERP